MVVGAEDITGMAENLHDVEVVFSTWGMPSLTSAQLDLLPRLRAVFYAAGSVKSFATPLLERGIIVASAWTANAIPVAEYTLSQILFGLKAGWQHVRAFQDKPGPESWRHLEIREDSNSTVGIVSLGQIGCKVCELLEPFAVTKLAYDPYVSTFTLRKYKAEQVSLEELFVRSDVVTVHAPLLKATEGLITGALISSMKPNATIINTSRGAVICENELIEVLRQRLDIVAVLDVTHPEPPAVGSPLYSLRNIILTPHIAGSIGNEVRRMADWMIDEFISWQTGRPLRYAITLEMAEIMA